MHGPSPATTLLAPRSRMVSMARARTPAARPRHPTCTAPCTPSGEPSATEAQSAVRTVRANPSPDATRASPSGGAFPESCTHATAPSGTGVSTTTTPAACTWWRRRTVNPDGTRAGSGPSPIDRWAPSPPLVPSAGTRGPASDVSTALAEERGDVELVVTEVEVVLVGCGED